MPRLERVNLADSFYHAMNYGRSRIVHGVPSGVSDDAGRGRRDRTQMVAM